MPRRTWNHGTFEIIPEDGDSIPVWRDGAVGVPDGTESEEVFALRSFACELSCTTKCFGPLPRTFFGWLFVVLPEFHFAKNAFALQFLFQRAECLINVVVANLYLHRCCHPLLRGL